MIHRSIEENIRKALAGKKAVTLMGARQVGKSTLTEALFSGEEHVLVERCKLNLPSRHLRPGYHRGH